MLELVLPAYVRFVRSSRSFARFAPASAFLVGQSPSILVILSALELRSVPTAPVVFEFCFLSFVASRRLAA